MATTTVNLNIIFFVILTLGRRSIIISSSSSASGFRGVEPQSTPKSASWDEVEIGIIEIADISLHLDVAGDFQVSGKFVSGIHISFMFQRSFGHVAVMLRSCCGHVAVMLQSCCGHVASAT